MERRRELDAARCCVEQFADRTKSSFKHGSSTGGGTEVNVTGELNFAIFVLMKPILSWMLFVEGIRSELIDSDQFTGMHR